MSKTCWIYYIESWDHQMKDFLYEFCDEVKDLGDARNDQLKLPLVMSWWEIHCSWLPGVRKDRIKRYRETLVLDGRLNKSITNRRRRIIEKLDCFDEYLKEAVKDAGREGMPIEEKAAVQAVWDAFREFTVKFKNYNWLLRLGSDQGKESFLQRYPNAHYIYITASSNS